MFVHGLIAALIHIGGKLSCKCVVGIEELYVFKGDRVIDLPAVRCSVGMDIEVFRRVIPHDTNAVCLFGAKLVAQAPVRIDLEIEIVGGILELEEEL